MTRRALVLGAGGFLGSHLCRHLLGSGWTVTGVTRNPASAEATRRLAGLSGDIELVAGHAADPDLLEALIPHADAVFPFAGRSGAAASMTSPLADLAANGTTQLAVLEAVRQRNPTARVVFPGSRLQYGRCEQLPVTEQHPQRPTSIYGVHKLLGEHYHRLYYETYGIPTTVVRISNPYGPAQERCDGGFGVVGTFLRQAADGLPIRLYGGGGQLRDYLYVDDLMRLVELVVTTPDARGGVFNASGPGPVSLREMAETVVATVGRGSVTTAPWPSAEAGVETGDYVGDGSKAAAVLGWVPEITLREGLTRTWAALAAALAS